MLALLLAAASAAPASVAPAAPSPGVSVRGQPYVEHRAVDRFGREVTYYLSDAPGRLPLACFVQGSGCGSLFARDGERIVPRAGHASIVDAMAGRARVLIVEKPGVAAFDEPADGSAAACSASFRQEHVLDRWAAAIEAALDDAARRPSCLPAGALIAGHSEGGLVACRVARERPELVSHVAVLAGGGASQLVSLAWMAREGRLLGHASADPEARVQRLLADWQRVLDDPQSPSKLFLGHPHRRWSSFLASSPMEELGAPPTRARVYVAQGQADDAVDPASADVLFAHLRSRGVTATLDRVPGADHSFRAGDEDGWRAVFERIGAWWLGTPR